VLILLSIRTINNANTFKLLFWFHFAYFENKAYITAKSLI
jgi:hypothetical protein